MRKLYQLCLLFTCATVLPARANGTAAGLPEIKADSASFTGLEDQNYQILPDPSAKLPFAQVRVMQFNPIKTDGFRIKDFNTRVYWCKFSFKNTLPKPVNVAFIGSISRIDVFGIDSAGTINAKNNRAGCAVVAAVGFKTFQAGGLYSAAGPADDFF
jgi:hypothetical protein